MQFANENANILAEQTQATTYKTHQAVKLIHCLDCHTLCVWKLTHNESMFKYILTKKAEVKLCRSV